MQKVNPLNLILAIFLPPLGALLQVGLSAHFFLKYFIDPVRCAAGGYSCRLAGVKK